MKLRLLLVTSTVALLSAISVLVSARDPGHQATATGVGPTISFGTPSLVSGKVQIPVLSSGSGFDPYAGFSVHLRWTPGVFTFSSATSSGGLFSSGLCPPADTTSFDSDGGGVIFQCAFVSGSTTSTGLLATFNLTPGSTGCFDIHMFTFGPPDNGASGDGTYTLNDGTFDEQANTYGADLNVTESGAACTPPTSTPTNTPTPTATFTPTNTPTPTPTFTPTNTPTFTPTNTPTPPPANTYIVNTTSDYFGDWNLGDGICEGLSPGSGQCSLRAAIQQANFRGVPAVINFAIPPLGTGIDPTITETTTSPLPVITVPITINGETQACACSFPLVEIDGGGIVTGDGLELSGGNSLIRGLVIDNFLGNGLRIESNNNQVYNSKFGTDLTGGVAGPGNTANGIVINNAANNQIGSTNYAVDAVITSANGGDGIAIAGADSTNNRLQGVGSGIKLPVTTNAALANGSWGIEISNAPANTIDTDLVSGNAFHGLAIDGASATGNVVTRSAFGTNFDVNAAIPNAGDGIVISGGASANVIGGVGLGNTISGNGGEGVAIFGSGSNRIQGNVIGLDRTGVAAVGNAGDGVNIAGVGANTNVVGGTNPGERNVISGNGVGVGLGSGATGNVLEGNYIGTNAAGTAAIPNSQGVWVQAAGNTVGGTVPGARNVISGNTSGTGIFIASGGGTTAVLGNYIGTNASGTGALPNSNGMTVADANATIGDGTAAGRNVIAGNGFDGIDLNPSSDGASIRGNYIGVGAGGAALPNGRDGVIASPGVAGPVTIGAPGAGNVIANNSGVGVGVDKVGVPAAARVSVRGNAIYDNGGGGIIIDPGANGGVAAPGITSVSTSVTGTSSCASCTVDVYSDAGSQGKIWQGSTTTDGGGNWTYFGVLAGPNVTATVTDGIGDTSAFSPPSPVILQTLFGDGTAGFGGDGGPAQDAQASQPRGMYVTAAHDLYFADSGNNAVRLVLGNAPAGTIDTVAGRGALCGNPTDSFGDGCGPKDATLNTPRDVSVDPAGNLYIADTGDCLVRKVTPGPDGKVNGGTGEIITAIAGTGTCGFNGTSGSPLAMQLDQPSGVAVDAAGNVYIADTNNNRIARVDAGGTLLTTVAGTGTAGFADGPALTAKLDHPRDVSWLPLTNTIFIADTGNNRIRVLTGATIGTFAGTGTAGFSGDGGPATAAQLYAPEAVVATSSWSVYIADTQNNVIRAVPMSTGLINTVVGHYGPGGQDPPAAALDLQLHQPAGYGVGSSSVADTSGNRADSTGTTIDPTTGQSTVGASPGASCTPGPLASATGDWLLPPLLLGMIATRKRWGRMMRAMLARMRPRPARSGLRA